ncbi:factor associated with metabolism and energy isoform X1 [Emydura macquarii macquarii]|uniref:factor associated with metabolism and energy isoform X1 n=1 Tax=Emydura macquarii macquarii TaxID=1129001 RepID=UPI00352BB1D8
MVIPCTKCSSARRTPELLNLISICGEETMQSQLHSSRRNYDPHSQISRSMAAKSYEWDTWQCHVKIKELRQGYQKARESDCRSGAEPKTCRFDKELEAIFSGDPTSIAKRTVDTSTGLETVDTGLNPNEEVVDEMVELEDNAEQGTGMFADMGSQDLFLTPEASHQSQLSSSGMLDAGGELGCVLEGKPFHSCRESAAEKKITMKKQRDVPRNDPVLCGGKKRKRGMKTHVSENHKTDRQERRENQEQVIAGHGCMIKTMEEQTELLKSLITLQTEFMCARPPFQPIQNCFLCPPQTPPTHSYQTPGPFWYSVHSTPSDSFQNNSLTPSCHSSHSPSLLSPLHPSFLCVL